MYHSHPTLNGAWERKQNSKIKLDAEVSTCAVCDGHKFSKERAIEDKDNLDIHHGQG